MRPCSSPRAVAAEAPTEPPASLARSDLIFSVPKIVSFLSQGTTLPPGTIILTGCVSSRRLEEVQLAHVTDSPSRSSRFLPPRSTPAGVGWSSEPQTLLKDGDDFRVFVSHGVGTLINQVVEEE